MLANVSAIIIDDDKDTVGVFRDYLKLKKISVLGVGYNGLDAVNLYKKYQPDVVFLDHRMPEYDGTYALHHIREIDPNSTVIIITADNMLDLNPKIKELQPSAIIHKPFDITEVLKTVESVIPKKLLTDDK